MPGKSEEWSPQEIRIVIRFLNSGGFSNEEICNRIWEVCGPDSVSREEVHHILAEEQGEEPTAGRRDSTDVQPTEDDIEISDFPALNVESTSNYPIQSSKCMDLSGSRNQWKSSTKQPYDKCSSKSHDLSNLEKTDLQNCDEYKVLYKKLHNMFKKFSLENFSVSPSKIKKLDITTEENLDNVINIVFEKAVENPDFSIPYANLCKRLSLLKVPCHSQASHFVVIGQLLLTKCEKEFEKSEVTQLCRDESRPIEVHQTVKEEPQEIADKKQKRRRQLGTARFMGWLFKLDIFTESMIQQVITNLLNRGDEVAIECVCVLIAAIGKELNSDMIETCISDMKKRIDEQYAGTQLEDILQQISDLKMNNWVSCVVGKSNKIIDEILSKDHEEKSTETTEEILGVDQDKMLEHKKMPLQTECGDNISDANDQKEVLKGDELFFGEKKKKKKKKIKFPSNSDLGHAPEQSAAAASVVETFMRHSDLPAGGKVQKNDSSVTSCQMQDSPAVLSEETKGKDIKKLPVNEVPFKTATYEMVLKGDELFFGEKKKKKKKKIKFPSNSDLGIHPEVVRDSATMGHKSKSSGVTSINTLAKQQVKLNTSENACSPSCQTESESTAEDDQTQNLCKKVCSILNELTPGKLSSLVSQVKQLGITTEESMNGVVEAVFETAVSQHDLTALCAQMCHRLALLKVEGQSVNFRKILITKCQRKFQEETDKQKQEKKDEKRRQFQKDHEQEEKNKRRHLGNIRFIGELFKLKMFTESVMHQYIKMLSYQGGGDDSLECLCCLLTCIGKELENGKKSAAMMERYFSDIKEIVDNRQTSSTVQLMLQDVIKLRMNNWVPFSDEDKPQTTDQTHEAKTEQMFQQETFLKSISDSGQKKESEVRVHPRKTRRLKGLPIIDPVTGLYVEGTIGEPSSQNTKDGSVPQSDSAAPSQFSSSQSLACDFPSDNQKSYNQTAESEVRVHARKTCRFKGLPIIDPATGLYVEGTIGEPSSQNTEDGSVPQSDSTAPSQFASSQSLAYSFPSDNRKSYNHTAAFFGQMSNVPSTCSQIPQQIGVQACPTKTPHYKHLPIIDPITGRDVAEDTSRKESSQGTKDGSQSKLELTTNKVTEDKQITPEEMKQNLQRLLHDHESNEEIINWLEGYVEEEMSPPMYRTLVTAIYESVITGSGANCELNISKLKDRMCVLTKYMDANRNLELHALFALQYLMNKLDHPKGILLQMLDLAYNENFISDDALKKWEHSDDPDEQEGKDSAIYSVRSFFTCLKEGDKSSESN